MGTKSGLTLLEVLVMLSLAGLLSLAFFNILNQFQRWETNLHQLLQRDENLRLAPLLLARLVSAAGNNKWQTHWTGLEIDGGSLILQSDLDGDQGFPDLSLNQPFENLGIRHRGDELQLRSGAGSFQPLLKNIQAMEIWFDDNLLTLSISGTTEGNSSEASPEEVSFDFFLWNYRKNLFPEAP